MNGEALYKLWVDVNQKLGVGSDDWEDLGDMQEAWEMLAEKLAPAEDCT